ncbi:chalcone isomerase family protein [Planctobacterium marinum]|uniref:chalcone isomerase family protein n=1 Tax=Planctobacterium marinum TaxID=1631968 RepID=UPI001E41C8DC|nr:chalcone isomerase family protein [Planctobacterium marinum]MCC2606997.1 chalcone isomerase family protein [Planctobacterium marinum]
MKTWRSLLLAAGMFLISGHLAASPQSPPWPSMQLVGEGKLSVLFWDIYEARLYSANGIYQSDQFPVALKLTYLRDFSKQQLIEETVKQWQKLGFYDEQKVLAWTAELQQLWPDVKRQQSLTLYIDEAQISYFYFNDEQLGTLSDQQFARAFLAIWLSPNTSAPDVRKQLIGQN